VVRAFDSEMLARPADPGGDIRAFDDEMMLTDLLQIENRLSRLKKEKDSAHEQDLLGRLKTAIESEQPLRVVDLTAEELAVIAGFRFLSLKPLLLLLNAGEEQAAAGPPPDVAQIAASKQLSLIAMCGKAEMEIAELAPDEQQEFLQDLG